MIEQRYDTTYACDAPFSTLGAPGRACCCKGRLPAEHDNLMMQWFTAPACLDEKAANRALEAARLAAIKPTEPSAQPPASSHPLHAIAVTSAGKPWWYRLDVRDDSHSEVVERLPLGTADGRTGSSACTPW